MFPRLAVSRSTMRGYSFVISWLTWSCKSATSAWRVAPLSAQLGWGLSTGEVWVCRGCCLKTGAVVTWGGVVSTRLAGGIKEGSIGIESVLHSRSGAPCAIEPWSAIAVVGVCLCSHTLGRYFICTLDRSKLESEFFTPVGESSKTGLFRLLAAGGAKDIEWDGDSSSAGSSTVGAECVATCSGSVRVWTPARMGSRLRPVSRLHPCCQRLV